MKDLKISLILLSLLLLSFASFSQAKKFKCDASAYADEHTNDQRWNDLIDNACTEINKGKYEEGYLLLVDAMILDSLTATDGVIHEYIGVQLRNLKKFIDNSKEESTTSETKTEELPSRDHADTIQNTGAEAIENSGEPGNKKDEQISRDLTDEKTAEKNQEELNKNATVKVDDPKDQPKSIDAENSSQAIDKPVTEIPEPVKPEEIPIKSNESEKKFSETELEEFHVKGIQKVRQLEEFIITIASKTSSSAFSMQATENAVLLFDSEDRLVQVSSTNRTEKPKFKIRVYFQRLRNLNYDNVVIEWADFQYASDFIKARDGSYRGYITFTQRFTSTKDNRVTYSDETTKKIEVILKVYQKTYEGEITDNWDVFIGDISVVQTDKN